MNEKFNLKIDINQGNKLPSISFGEKQIFAKSVEKDGKENIKSINFEMENNIFSTDIMNNNKNKISSMLTYEPPFDQVKTGEICKIRTEYLDIYGHSDDTYTMGIPAGTGYFAHGQDVTIWRAELTSEILSSPDGTIYGIKWHWCVHNGPWYDEWRGRLYGTLWVQVRKLI